MTYTFKRYTAPTGTSLVYDVSVLLISEASEEQVSIIDRFHMKPDLGWFPAVCLGTTRVACYDDLCTWLTEMHMSYVQSGHFILMSDESDYVLLRLRFS